MEKFQFISLEPNKSGPERNTFLEAWNDMYLYVKDLLDRKALAIQVLETCIWLEVPWNHNMPFYDARDHAIREGWQQPK